MDASILSALDNVTAASAISYVSVWTNGLVTRHLQVLADAGVFTT